jgi:type II restriction enzyme
MTDPKKDIEAIIVKIKDGEIPPEKAWAQIRKMQPKYLEIYNQQSWNSYIGNKFQEIIHAIIKSYLSGLKQKDSELQGFEILTASEVKGYQVIMRKLVVQYGDFFLLPDVDSVIVWFDKKNEWQSKIIAIASCKTSLRERIAQACYWKLKLVSSDIQKHIKVFLATADHDGDFSIGNSGERFDGKSRDRVIAEYELDGIYIIRENFVQEWESEKVKKFERIFTDLIELFHK